jgi:hypothetical protein
MNNGAQKSRQANSTYILFKEGAVPHGFKVFRKGLLRGFATYRGEMDRCASREGFLEIVDIQGFNATDGVKA